MEKQAVFQAIYQAFDKHDYGIDTLQDLKNDLKTRFETIDSNDLCHKIKDNILQCI